MLREEGTVLAGRRVARSATVAVFGTARIRHSFVPEGEAPLRLDAGPEAVGLHAVRTGAVIAETAVGPRRFLAGDAFAAGDRTPPLALRGDVEVLSLLVPRDAFVGVETPRGGEVRVITKDNPLLAPTMDFIGRAGRAQSDEISGFTAYYFERLLQEMMIGLLVSASASTPVPQGPGTFLQAVAAITAQRADPALSPRSVARHLNLSLRQLQRAFQARSTTVEREIRRARVQHAVALLRDRSYDSLSVEQIGQYSGFAGGSSLARAMAAEGFESPARVRRTSRSGH
ncbi:hypothetical protein CVS47_00510 [Microbacterium lemovicicum]|uniref:HTH araC/xylS-type domain-containing protein n=1 Tax=Microbacterium lemovicicum TaxID=1072463 RepID=A0A3Q9J1R5_9MICO|nr:AraC family transcriptional regulator [Microbacterium lemovicicum]AZS35912.1 hypothetical protein CVS47_00510 [Microbacterium lemovicicum]